MRYGLTGKTRLFKINRQELMHYSNSYNETFKLMRLRAALDHRSYTDPAD